MHHPGMMTGGFPAPAFPSAYSSVVSPVPPGMSPHGAYPGPGYGGGLSPHGV